MTTLPLSALAAFIRRVFALNLPNAVWISAELAGVKHSRGHCWLTLVEKDPLSDRIIAQLDAVIWSAELAKLKRTYGGKMVDGVLREGMSVRLEVTTSFHERFGLKLLVEDIDPAHTIGSLERIRQATLESLSQSGLLDRNARLNFPALPQRLAVISSETAAGLSDFMRQLEQNGQGYRFYHDMYPAAMQGRKTSEEIRSRLRQINRRRDEYDCAVIIRGGGGKTDLAAFDEEVLCRAVADFSLPVIVGIGHEVDDTVLDRVAHRSEKTPTAVAVYLVEQLRTAEEHLINTGRRIASQASTGVTREVLRLTRMQDGIYQGSTALLAGQHLRFAAVEKEVLQLSATGVKSANEALLHREALLEALRPETTLARGYAMVEQNGKLVTAADQLEKGDVQVRLRRGKITLRKD